jgi:hypothetical protein
LRYSFLVRISFVLAVLLTGWACDNGDTPIDPTNPPTVTDTFNGTLTRNGSQLHTFTATARGTVTATLTSVTPADSPAIGLSMGTWDAAFEVCTAVLTNNAATTSSVLTGSVVGISPLCVRLFDPNSAIPENAPITYTVTVQRPVEQ